MWLFTRYGFYSASVKTKGSRVVNVRARSREHLDNLIKRFRSKYRQLADCKVIELPSADYRYRIEVPQKVWAGICFNVAIEQTWSNFKNECSRYATEQGQDHDYSGTLHDVWSIMFRYQNRAQKRDARHMVEDIDWSDLGTRRKGKRQQGRLFGGPPDREWPVRDREWRNELFDRVHSLSADEVSRSIDAAHDDPDLPDNFDEPMPDDPAAYDLGRSVPASLPTRTREEIDELERQWRIRNNFRTHRGNY